MELSSILNILLLRFAAGGILILIMKNHTPHWMIC